VLPAMCFSPKFLLYFTRTEVDPGFGTSR
jgi:hypothetical protein